MMKGWIRMFLDVFGLKKEEPIAIMIDDTERRIIVRALTDLRTKQIEENKNYDFIDELIVRVCDATTLRKTKRHEER